MNTKTIQRDINRPTAITAAATPQAIIQSRMNYNSSRQRDPVTRAERDMSVLSPDIDNNGGCLYNPETFCIVHRFESEGDKQRRENEECGYGSYNDAELCTYVKASFYDSYEDEAWSFDQPTYDYYGTYSDQYIQMVMDGDVIDDGLSCRMPSTTLGGSVLLGGWEYDFNSELDLYEDYGLYTEYDDLSPPQTLMEEDIANEDKIEQQSELDSKAQSPIGSMPQASMSAAQPPIQSSISLSSQFANATSPPSEPSDEPSAEVPLAPRATTMAANQPSYQRSA